MTQHTQTMKLVLRGKFIELFLALWILSTMKLVLRGKFIELHALTKKLERSCTSKVTADLEILENKRQTHPRGVEGHNGQNPGWYQTNRNKDNDTKNINKIWLFEKINKIEKPPDKLTKVHRKSIQMYKIKQQRARYNNRKRKFKKLAPTTKDDTQQVKKNLDEVDEFLNSYHFPKLNEEQENDLNSLIFSKEIEEFMNSLKIYQPKSKTIKEKKAQGQVQNSIRPSKEN